MVLGINHSEYSTNTNAHCSVKIQMKADLEEPCAVEEARYGLCERNARPNLNPHRLMLRQTVHFGEPRVLRYVGSEADVSTGRIPRPRHIKLDAR
jgi:hypothetical protein